MTHKRLIKFSLMAAGILAAVTAGAAGVQEAHSWIPVKKEVTDAKIIAKTTEIEILVASGAIIVNATRPVQVKVFSILGRIISDNSLPAGTSRLPLSAHGVYIVTAGELTCKVAV